MGALKQMLIKEKMRISEEWDNLKHNEYIVWQDNLRDQHFYTYKKELDNKTKEPPKPSDNKLM